MPMDDKKKKVVLEATKKLIASEASDKEILQSLQDVGVIKEDAKVLLDEAKKQIAEKKKQKTITKAEKPKPAKEKMPSEKIKKKAEVVKQAPAVEKEPTLREIVRPEVEKKAAAEAEEKVVEKPAEAKVEIPPKEEKKPVVEQPKEKKVNFWDSKQKEFWKITGEPKETEGPSLFGKIRNIIKREERVVEEKRPKPIKPLVKDDWLKTEEKKVAKPEAVKPIIREVPKEFMQKPVVEKKSKVVKPVPPAVEKTPPLREIVKPAVVPPKEIVTKRKPIAPKEVKPKRSVEVKKAGRKTELPSSVLTLLIIPNKEYINSMIKINKELDKKYRNICYVSLNELFDNLIKNFEKNNISTDKFFFVDAITRTTQVTIPKRADVAFVTSPNALVELSLAISEALEKQKPDVLLFDSLSTLLIYEKESTVTKFIHSLIGKIKSAGSDCVLTALEGDVNNESIKDLGMFMDEVLTMNEYELYKIGLRLEQVTLPPGKAKEKIAVEAPRELEPAGLMPKMIYEQRPIYDEAVKEEMKTLRKRLLEIESRPMLRSELIRLEKKIESLGKKPRVIESATLLRSELRRLEKRIAKIKQPKLKDSTPLIRKELKKIEKKIAKIGKKPEPKVSELTPTIRKGLKQLSKKLAQIEKKPTTTYSPSVVQAELKKLEKRLARIEKKPAVKIDIKKLAKKIRKQKAAPIAKEDLRRLEKKLLQIEGRVGEVVEKKLKERKKGLEQKRKKIEKRKEKDVKQISLLEKKLALLNRSYHLGIVSEDAYLKDKAKIEALLKR